MYGKNSITKRSVGSVAIVALLLLGIVTVMPLANRNASAQAGVTITTSADPHGGSFFGPAIVEVRIQDPALAADNTQSLLVPVSINAFGATQTITVDETSGTSGTLLIYLKADADKTTAETPFFPASPLNPTFANLIIGTGAAHASYTPTGPAVLRQISATVTTGGTITISYGGISKTITYVDSPAQLTLDRTTYGPGATVFAQIYDPDINLDPTAANTITQVANALLAGTGVPAGAVFTETGTNTARFETTFTVPALGAGIESTSQQLTVNDYDTFTSGTLPAVVQGGSIVGSSNLSYVEEMVRGTIQPLPTLNYSSELPVVVSDSDRNLNSRSQESDNASANRLNIGGTLFNIKEQNQNSNNWVPNYSQDRVKLTWKSTTNAATGTFFTRPGSDVVIQYNDASGFTNPTSQITFQLGNEAPTITTAKPTYGRASIANITLTDAELNDDSAVAESYTFTFAAAGTTVATINAADAAAAYDLEIQIAGSTKTIGAAPFAVTFTETGPNTGVFRANVRLGDLAAALNPVYNFADGDTVRFKITDKLDNSLTVFPDSSVTVTIGLEKPTIVLDRTTIGVPRNAGIAAVTSGTTIPGGVTAAFANLGPQIIHVTVTDSASNTNSLAENTLLNAQGPVASTTGGIWYGHANGVLDQTAAGATFRISLLDANGNPFVGAGSMTVTKAIKETGLDTGVFTGELSVAFNPIDTPAQWIGSKIKFEYAGADATFGTTDDADSQSIGMTARNAILSTNTQVVTNGQAITITVRDEDGNRDATVAERVSVGLRWVDDTGATQERAQTLDETGINTGIFSKTINIGTSTVGGLTIKVQADQDFRIRYYDLTPSIPGGSTWPVASSTQTQIDLTLRTSSSTGGLVLEPQQVGPATQIKVTVTDSDLNTNPSSKQIATGRVTVVTDRGAASRADLNVEETGVNTGIFTGKVRMNAAQAAGAPTPGPATDVTVNALPGDLVSVRYEDEKGANGQRTTVTKTVNVVSVDPKMNFTKSTYSVGDSIEVTIDDLDANRDPDTADILTLRVTSTTDAVGLTNVQAIETGANTGVFKAIVQTSRTFSTGALQVSNGDNVTVEYEDAFPANFRQKFDANGTLAGSTQKFRINTVIGVQATTDSTTPTAPALANVDGSTVTEVTSGQQVVITSNVTNNDDQARPATVIVEVRDADDITVYLQWQTATIAANGEIQVGLSWIPETSGTYTIRTFVISDLANPMVLSEVAESEVTVS